MVRWGSDSRSLAEDIPLVESLRFAVPLYMADLVARPPTEREATAQGWQSVGSRVVGERGDVLLHRTPNRMRTANAFEWLAKGLAAAAVLYGEARFPGLVFRPPPTECWATEPERSMKPRRPVVTVELPEVVSADGR